MTTNIDDGLERLNSLLPLKARQNQLNAAVAEVHRATLQSFVENGLPLNRTEVAERVGQDNVDATLSRLDQDDLVVLSSDKQTITGSYPFTIEETVHQVEVNGKRVHAMCALDALSVAPMFKVATVIHSRCHVSGTPVDTRMQDSDVLEVSPPDVQIGIRWQSTSGCAAHSLCMEMVFLQDLQTAREWQENDPENISLFNLPDAVAFGAAFFRPLLD